MEVRSPILVTIGHIDAGKTTLLDKIRESSTAEEEAGGITQNISSTYIPTRIIRKLCGKLLEDKKIKVPGLLFIDTPGHEAFTTLRRRGGSIADLAILVIDITQGFKPQTDESLTFLREFKTPFVVAATKVDRIPGWIKTDETCFIKAYEQQNKKVRERVDNAIYGLMGELSKRELNANRFDKVANFKKEVAIVPTSGITGEGIGELLMILIGLSQRFLEEEIELKSDIGLGNVLEVKELRGMGTTIDVILYDGKIGKGDNLVIGGETPIVTKIRALLEPNPLAELRTEKQFNQVDEVHAASGVKIAAPNLEHVIPGSPLRVTSEEEKIEELKEELQKEIKEVQFESEGEGVIIKADTLGSLEALIKILGETEIPIKKAKVGNISKRDVMEAKAVEDPLKKVIFAFNVGVSKLAKDLKEDIRIFKSSVIYKLLEEYEEWKEKKEEELKKEKLEGLTRPGKLKFLPGYVFRQRKPAIIGIRVLEGVVKPGYSLVKEGKLIGRVEKVQKQGKNVSIAKKGDKVAISIDKPTVGRQIKEGDIFYNALSRDDVRKLEDLKEYLNRDEIELLEEVKEKI